MLCTPPKHLHFRAFVKEIHPPLGLLPPVQVDHVEMHHMGLIGLTHLQDVSGGIPH
jgi:hypothetical protein